MVIPSIVWNMLSCSQEVVELCKCVCVSSLLVLLFINCSSDLVHLYLRPDNFTRTRRRLDSPDPKNQVKT